MIKKALSQTIKILLILLCAVAVVSGLWLIKRDNTAGNNAAADTVASDPVKGDSVAGVEYYHYDTADFDQMCEELIKASKANNTDEVIRLYDALYSECEEVETLYAAAYILYSTDMDNDSYSDEQLYSYSTLEKCEDKLCGICHDIALSSNADAFHEHVGDVAFAAFEEYKPYTKREWELIETEQKLVDDYYDLYTDPEISYEYNGTVWDLDKLEGNEGNDLYESNMTDYFTIADEIEKKFNEKAGPIFIKLVKLRNEFAKLRGYDDYPAFADEVGYSRDYSEADITMLHKNVKKVSGAFIPLYYNYYYENDGKDLPYMSNDELLDVLFKYSEKTSSTAAQAADTLKNENLYSIDNGKNRQPGGYTIFLPKIDRPFIFITSDGDENVLPTLTHEFGHFTEDLNDKRNNSITDKHCIDLAEIASNGFEGLMSHYYEEIFPDQAEIGEKEIIIELMENILFGCLEDEFQREVFRNPDLSLQEINELYAKLYNEYGINAGKEDYSWVLVTHLFEQPMYNISYAVSGLAAMQIWSNSKIDFEGAVKTWEEFLKEGVFNKTYLDVVGRCGLIKFTEPGAVEAICEPALDELR